MDGTMQYDSVPSVSTLRGIADECVRRVDEAYGKDDSYVDRERGLLTEYSDGYTDGVCGIESYCMMLLEKAEDRLRKTDGWRDSDPVSFGETDGGDFVMDELKEQMSEEDAALKGFREWLGFTLMCHDAEGDLVYAGVPDGIIEGMRELHSLMGECRRVVGLISDGIGRADADAGATDS